MHRAFSLCFISIIFISKLIIADTEIDSLPTFVNPLFTPQYQSAPFDGGQIYYLTPSMLTTLNVKQVNDLLNYDIRFFQPDLVTDGQETIFSMLGSGNQGIKATWRGRPLRNPLTGAADLNRLSHIWVGGLRSVHSGALGGVSGSHGTVELLPVDEVKSEPLTLLHHREGFYSFQPVSFVHSRRLSINTDLFMGGYFPSSPGRFENAVHDGSNLFAEIRKQLTGNKILSIAHQTRNDKVGITFTDSSRSVRDNDLDLSIYNRFSSVNSVKLFGYHLERAEKDGKFRAHSRVWGAGVSSQIDSFGIYGRIGRIDIDMQSTEKIRIIEVESSVSTNRILQGYQLWGLVGIGGWLPDRTGINIVLSVDRWIKELGSVGLVISRNSDPLTPEILYADYCRARPSKVMNTVWRAAPDLPVQGRILPKTTTDNAELHWSRSWREYSSRVSVFHKMNLKPVIWMIEDDTIIPRTRSDHRTNGWMTKIDWKAIPYRASLSMVSIFRNEDDEDGVPGVMPEPRFRLTAEYGWHRIFMNGRFEADISLSGNYLNSYFAQAEGGWEKMGGAYPLHLKMSGRIRSFTFYYGVHNWNSYQYFTVPGYKMMHKEEYWGINWLIMN
jgi:hypothetical protein